MTTAREALERVLQYAIENTEKPGCGYDEYLCDDSKAWVWIGGLRTFIDSELSRLEEDVCEWREVCKDDYQIEFQRSCDGKHEAFPLPKGVKYISKCACGKKIKVIED